MHSPHAGYAVWIGLCVFAFLIAASAKHYPFFPGDVATERWVQSLVPRSLHWAERISQTAEFPQLLLIVAIVFCLSWVLAGWRAALLSVLSVAGMVVLGLWLGPVIGRPRPSPALVRVLRPLKGSGFPSLFALRYGATFGFLAVLAMKKGSGGVRGLLAAACAALLLLGWFARVALAAHWPSDVLFSYFLAVLWAALLIRVGASSP